jgi:hypothetical protein
MDRRGGSTGQYKIAPQLRRSAFAPQSRKTAVRRQTRLLYQVVSQKNLSHTRLEKPTFFSSESMFHGMVYIDFRVSNKFLKVGKPILGVPLAESLPAFHRVSIAMFLAKMPRRRDVDAFQSRVSS